LGPLIGYNLTHDPSSYRRLRTHVPAPVPNARHHQLSGSEDADVPEYRGKQVLMRDENGLEKCVACGLCAVACPADAIYLEAAENDGTVMAGPRYASTYQIHKTRCIFCGYCEEACPVSAIFMGKDYELAVYSKDDFIWDKSELLVPEPTR
jgi:NADH-quinone oxidoreductase subunit I